MTCRAATKACCQGLSRDVKGALFKAENIRANHWLIGEEMNIEESIHDLRARINPQ